MTPGTLSIAENLAILRLTPASLADSIRGLSAAQLRAPLKRDEWSIAEVLAHLRACADVWGRAMALIVHEDHPTIKAVNPRTWIEQTNYRDLQVRGSLRAFSAQRRELLSLLGPLPARAWSRFAAVTGAGRPLQQTVLAYATRMARHERTHVRQIERIAVTWKARPGRIKFQST